MKRLIEIDPNKLFDTTKQNLLDHINMARAAEVNKMIVEHVPVWKVYLLKKSEFFSRLFGIFTIIQPQKLLERDVLRERLILCKGSKKNPKQIAEKLFFIQDKRKINEGYDEI